MLCTCVMYLVHKYICGKGLVCYRFYALIEVVHTDSTLSKVSIKLNYLW